MDVEIIELGRDRLPEMVELCRESLDLPEDALEASAVVVTVAERAEAGRSVLRLGAVRDGALIGVLVGSLSAADPRLGHVDLVAVAPRERRQGVGGALLAEAESRLGALGAGEVLLAGNPPYYAWPGIDVRYTPAVCAAPRDPAGFAAAVAALLADPQRLDALGAAAAAIASRHGLAPMVEGTRAVWRQALAANTAPAEDAA